MSTALGYIYEIYDKLIDFIFNKLEFVSGVTVGYVLVVCFVFIILVKNIVNLPRSTKGSIKIGGKNE